MNVLRLSFGKEHFQHLQDATIARRKLDIVKSQMSVLKNSGTIGISDHAVLRYLERYKGIDIAETRNELQKLIQEKVLIEGTEDNYLTNNGTVVVIPNNKVMATVLPKAIT